jgi:hypothetical protein
MSLHRAWALLLSFTTALGVVHDSHAITPVAAKDYGLQVTHVERARYALEQGQQGLELALTVKNSGPHDLSDVRLYVIRAGSKTIMNRSEPARVAKLAAGETQIVTWVFDSKRPIVGPIRDVIFRVEAIDQHTKDIVTFSQKSAEVR